MTPTLTCFFRQWLVWTLPLWRLLFSFRIVTINPWFITSNNLFKEFSSSLTISKLSWAISKRRFFCSVVSNFGMNFVHTRVIPKILLKICQTVVFGIPRSFSSSRTVNRRSPSIASRTRSIFSAVVVSEGRPERESLSTDVRPFLHRLYHYFICVVPILSFTKAFCIIPIVSVQLLPRLQRNLMQIRWSVLSVIFNYKQMRRTEKARCSTGFPRVWFWLKNLKLSTQITCFTCSTFLLLIVSFLRIFYEIGNLKKNIVRICKFCGSYKKVVFFASICFCFVSLDCLVREI